MRERVSILSACGALAAGEYLATFAVNYSELYPLVVFAAVLVVLFAHAFDARVGSFLAVLLFGAAIYFFASVADEQRFRVQPWLRNRPRQGVRESVRPSLPLVRVKADLSHRIGLGLPSGDETVELSRAILLGERRRLPQQTKRLFVDSGTMHVFAISGLHVMAVAQVFSCVLALILVPRRLCGLLAVPLLWGYVALIGFAPSAVRAALMASSSFMAPVFWRRPDALRSWALAFLVVHLSDPRLIVDVGNVLSFAVMLAIVLAGECVRDLAAWKGSLVVTFVAWAVGVPIAAHVFGRVTPGGLLANLVLIAAAKAAVVTGAVGVLASYVSETVSAHLNNLSALSIRAMVFVAEAVTRIPYANVETGCWSLLSCVVWYGVFVGLAVVILRVRERRLEF